MLRDAVVATSPAAIGVVKDVLDRYDVALETPSSWICEFAAKPVPVTVSVNATFMTADAGLILVSTGAGGGELTVNVLPLEVPPPGAGVCTLMVRVARLARSAADSTAVSMVALLNVVGRATPSNNTCEDATKPVPVTTSDTPLVPAATPVGEIALTCGAGFCCSTVTTP